GTPSLNIGTAGGNATPPYPLLRTDPAGSGKQLTAGATGLTSALSSTFSVSAAAASQLAFVQQPSNATAGVAIAPALTVQLRDAFGNNVSSGIAVVMSLSSGTGTLSGNRTNNTDAAGLATFNNLSINLSGSKNLSATSGALTPAVSSSFTLSPAAASHLVFTQQPTDAIAGVAIAPSAKVHVTDSFGNDVSGVAVTMTKSSGTGTLGGTTSRTSDSAGVATFNDLSIDLVGAKNLTASSTGLPSVASGSFTISAAAANQLAFQQQPSNATAGAAISPAVTVHVADSFGNNVPGVSVTMTINSGSGTLSGTTSQTAVGTCQATCCNLRIDLVGAKSLTAASGSLPSAVSSSFSISAAAASQLVFTQQPSDATAGVAISPAVKVRATDSF